MQATRWGLVCFDLDGTLVPDVSTGQYLAAKLGHAREMAQIEDAYAAGQATNADVTALDALHYRGLTPSDVSDMLDDIPVVSEVAETVAWLAAHGIPSAICTLAWRFVGDVFADRYGFMASSGPMLALDQDGRFTGEVESDFTESDKPVFVGGLCHSLGIDMAQVVHVGDSRSDIPLFGSVGFAVAMNATPLAAAAATVAIQMDSLLDVLGVIPGLV